MDYVVKLEAYEGPFDLLLDLIEQNEVTYSTYLLRSLPSSIWNTFILSRNKTWP